MGELPDIIHGALTPEFKQQAEVFNQTALDAIHARSPWFNATVVMEDPGVQRRFTSFLFGAQLSARIPQGSCSIYYENIYGNFIDNEPTYYWFNGNRVRTVGFNATRFELAVNRNIRSRDAIAVVLAGSGLMVGITEDFIYDEPAENGVRIGRYASLEARWAFDS